VEKKVKERKNVRKRVREKGNITFRKGGVLEDITSKREPTGYGFEKRRRQKRKSFLGLEEGLQLRKLLRRQKKRGVVDEQ